jgi:hemolysin activation/secretion protein
VTAQRTSRGTNVTVRTGVFIERQRSVERTTDFSIHGLFQEDDSVKAVIASDDIDVRGGRFGLDWFAGTDPNGFIFTGGVTGEAGFGDATYRRATARLSATRPLLLGLAGALEVATGTSWGDIPLQRNFFLGSSGTLRGFDLNEHVGPSFWRARAELATDLAAARIGAFTDVGWVGAPSAFRLDDPLASVGVGASLLDGIIRFDVARAIRGSDRWKVHLYLDGLF